MTTERPHLSVVLAASIDGKLSTAARDPVRFTSRRDRARLHALSDDADALLVGAATLRAEDPPLLPTEERAAARRARGLPACPVRAVASATLDLPVGGRALGAREGAPVVVYTPGAADPARRRALEASGAAVHELDLTAALGHLATAHGVRRVVALGGGVLDFELFERDLVDEVFLTICPVVIGGATAPTPVDGRGFAADRLRRLELVESSVEEGEVFLRYRVKRTT